VPFVLAALTISAAIVSATGGLNGLPILNGPIPTVGESVQFMKKRVGDFVHPGLWHTHDDLERIRNGVLNGSDPWKTAYQNFSTDSFSQADYTMQGPYAVLSRGPISNYSSFSSDIRAAYQNALMCKSRI